MIATAFLTILPFHCQAWFIATPSLTATRYFLDSSSSSRRKIVAVAAATRGDDEQDTGKQDKNKRRVLFSKEDVIPRELEESIRAWEQQKGSSSVVVQQGVGWVKEIATELWNEKRLQQRQQQQQQQQQQDSSTRKGMKYADLVQEGIFALLNVTFHDDEVDQHHHKNIDDDPKAIRQSIYRHLSRAMDEENEGQTLLHVPSRVKQVVNKARQVVAEHKALGKKSTAAAIAQKIGIAPDTLKLYVAWMQSAKNQLSVETTVEIYDPLLDLSPHFTNQEEWERRTGYNYYLDERNHQQQQEFVEEYMDESQQYEGEDEMWVHERQQQGPLKEAIPDKDDDARLWDDLTLNDMIRQDVGDFLGETLNNVEYEIIQMRFGLNDDDDDDTYLAAEPMSIDQVAKKLNMPKEDVETIERKAMQKMKHSYTSQFLESYLDDEDDDFASIEDSV